MLDAENVLTLFVDIDVARSMGIFTQDKDGNTLLLIRDEYKVLWENISCSRRKLFSDSAHAVINGTAGIGKSSFRWYLVWKWMNSDLGFEFRDIRVNSSGIYYIIESNGAARQVIADDFLFKANNSLALLDPCDLLKDKHVVFSMVIVTASPSSIVGQIGKWSLSEFLKLALIYVMKLWTLDEIKKVMPAIDSEILKKFSFKSGVETYCVPRWLTYEPSAIPGHIARCWTNLTQEAVKDFFLSKGGDDHKSPNLPYRLCIIVENGKNDWKVEGFISEYAASLVYKWAKIAANLTWENFISLLDHPLGGGLIGNWYERWALDSIASGLPLIVSNTLLPCAAVQGGTQDTPIYYFNALEEVDVDFPQTRLRRGPVKPDVAMLQGILYHPSCKVYPSIDAFGIAVSGELILLQFTKSLTHSPAEWEGICDVVSSTKEDMEVILIYCTPYVAKFRTPSCPTLDACPTKRHVTVCKGSVDSEFFVVMKEGRSIV